MDKKLKPDVFWAINSNKYDTYMVSSTDRISFKCEDLYRFMEDYAQLRLSAVGGSVCDGCGSKFDAMDIQVGVCYYCQKEIKQTDI